MTENEAINGLETLKYQCKHNGECGTCNICCSAIPLAIQAIEEIQQYRAIGTVEEFKDLKKKNEPKKIKGIRFTEAICPKCEIELFETYWAFGGIHYCSNCGQKLDWSE